MTLAEHRRSTVLRMRDEGCSEQEMAEALDVSEDTVMRILDRLEPPPVFRREPTFEKKPPRVRSQDRLHKQPQMAPSTGPGRATKSLPRLYAPCGTESAYRRHRRNNEPACESCSKAASAASQERKRALRERNVVSQ